MTTALPPMSLEQPAELTDPARAPQSAPREQPVQAEHVVRYVSTLEGTNLLLLVGPFADETDASSWLENARGDLVDQSRIDSAAPIRLTRLNAPASGRRRGDLGRFLGIRPRRARG